MPPSSCGRASQDIVDDAGHLANLGRALGPWLFAAPFLHSHHVGKFIKRFSHIATIYVPVMNTPRQLHVSLLKQRGEEKFNEPRGSFPALGPSSPHSERAGTRYRVWPPHRGVDRSRRVGLRPLCGTRRRAGRCTRRGLGDCFRAGGFCRHHGVLGIDRFRFGCVIGDDGGGDVVAAAGAITGGITSRCWRVYRGCELRQFRPRRGHQLPRNHGPSLGTAGSWRGQSRLARHVRACAASAVTF
jgi:hypothetical protein